MTPMPMHAKEKDLKGAPLSSNDLKEKCLERVSRTA